MKHGSPLKFSKKNIWMWMSDEFCGHFHCMAVGNFAPFQGWKLCAQKDLHE